MRVLSDAAVHPARIVLPVLDRFPDTPILGEMIFFNQLPHQAVMIYTPQGWIPLYATENNIWEEHIAEPKQKVFELAQEYNTDGKSINVYMDGIQLQKNEFAEIGRNLIAFKKLNEDGEDFELQGGEIFQFQIFNVRKIEPFNIKSFNRRVGIS